MRYYPKLPPDPSEPPANHTRNIHHAEGTEETEGKPEIPPPSNKPWLTLNQIKAVYWSDGFFDWHPCAVCGYTKLTSWQAETFQGNKAWLCEDCKAAWEKHHGF
jgi:hypothetical protein